MARKMKYSGIEWIGEIPANWVVKKLLLGLRTPICDGPHETPDYVEDGVPFISVDSLNESKTVSLENVKRYISEEQYNTYSIKAKLNEGDILFSKSATIGKTAIVNNEKFMVWSPLAIIKPNEHLYNVFLYYMLNCNELIKSIQLSGSYNTQANVGMREIEQSRIPFPSIAEQYRIASFLDSKCAEIDKAIEATKASIEEYRKLRQAIITETVTKGLDPDVEMKDSCTGYLGTVPSKWRVKKLRFLGSCQNGISKGAEFFGKKGYPFVSYSDVYKNNILPIPSETIDSTQKERALYSVEKGDIFFTRTSETIEEIGFSSVCLETIPNATFAGFLIRVRPINKELNEKYSSYYFRSDIHRRYFTKEMNLVTRASLGQTLLKNMPILIPPMDEQQRISDYLDTKCSEIESLIKSKEKLIEELTAYRKSLIYEYVTGKKEVPTV